MKKLLLLLSMSAILFSCSTRDNELIVPDDLINAEKLYVNPDGSNVMAAAGTPIYAKLVNSNTVHFFWDPQFTMRAILTYDIVLRYRPRTMSIGGRRTYARVVSAGTSSVVLGSSSYVLTGTEEFTGTLIKGGLFHKKDGNYLYFYTNSSFTQQAYLLGNVVVTYGILKTTITDIGILTELERISELVVPQWCESYELPIYTSTSFDPNVTREYIIFSCVWQ